MCRLVGIRMKSWEHVWEECKSWDEKGRRWQEVVRWVLGEEGEGEWWMRELESERWRKGGKRNEGRRGKR